MKKYLWTSLRIFLFKVYSTSTGMIVFVFLRPIFRTNCFIASCVIPLSLRDCSDQVRGSFHPMNAPDFTSCAPFDLDIFIPLIAKCPL